MLPTNIHLPTLDFSLALRQTNLLMKAILLSLLTLCVLASCQPSEQTQENMSEISGTGLPYANPPAEGFNEAASDERAMQLADSVMQAMGGRTAWDTTRYFAWDFFGRRSLLWDKQTGDVRIEAPQDSTIYAINVNDDTGQVMKNGESITNPDSLTKYVQQGKEIWINDSYWLFMPFKLKDSGVTLTYAGEDTIQGGAPAEKLMMTFNDVGVTPQNKYYVYVDPQDHLVTQWAYYPEASIDTPRFVASWNNYQEYGGLLLSGDPRGISNIRVLNNVPEDAFRNTETDMIGRL